MDGDLTTQYFGFNNGLSMNKLLRINYRYFDLDDGFDFFLFECGL